MGTRTSDAVAGHYDRLDSFYRKLWGEHVHHGLWSDSAFTSEEAVRHLVHQVAADAKIEAGSRVCDVGCGYGAPARLWAERYGARVTGFTVSAAQYTYALSQSVEGPEPVIHLQDILDNELPDADFDAVVMIESLAHIDDQQSVLQEASRLLRPGGRLVVCAWISSLAPPEWIERHLLHPICREGRLSRLPTVTDLHRWTTDAGLTVERLDDVTAQVRRTWTIVLRRFASALVRDPAVLRFLTGTAPDRIFARTLLRIWVAQHIGALRYGWLVATRE